MAQKRKSIVKRILRRLTRWSLWIAILCAGLVLIFRFVPPFTNYYIISERIRLGSLDRQWVPIEEFSPHMARAVVAAEDANFCRHFGLDFNAIRDALSDGERLRGGSTLTQQVAKNVFLWPGRSWLRKGLEAGFALYIEILWPKKRIVEVYLNVAEFDEGVFGAAAGARHYFGVEPDQITLLQAARMAAILPSPKKRSASRATAYTKKQTRKIMSGAETILADGRSKCFE